MNEPEVIDVHVFEGFYCSKCRRIYAEQGMCDCSHYPLDTGLVLHDEEHGIWIVKPDADGVSPFMKE